MARVNLTPSRIADYRCETGKPQSFLWDAKSTCLALRATRTGMKAFICQARLHGADIRMTLGKPETWTVQDAREAANRFQLSIDQGVDPRELVAKAKLASQSARAEKEARKATGREAWETYLKAPHPKWGATHLSDHRIAAQIGGELPKRGKKLTKPGPLSSLLARPLHATTAEVVSEWLQRESVTRPTATGNSLRKFRTFVNWCCVNPIYKTVVHADCAVARVVTDFAPPKKTKPDDALQKQDLKGWFNEMRMISNPVFSAYLQGLLLVGARRTEWQILKWTDVDVVGCKMTIRDKVDGNRTIPLTPYLRKLLESLPRFNKFVFGSPSSKFGYAIGMSKAHTDALRKAGLAHVSLHGLRRSFSTLSEWLELPVGVIAQIQGHKPSAIAEKHYKRRPIDLLRMHHEKFEAWILSEAGIQLKPTKNRRNDRPYSTNAITQTLIEKHL